MWLNVWVENICIPESILTMKILCLLYIAMLMHGVFGTVLHSHMGQREFYIMA